MSVSSGSAADLGNVPRLGQEKNVSIQLKNKFAVNKPKSAKVDMNLADRQSLHAKPVAVARKSVASLANENKGSVGKKVDIRV